jgi:CRP-like cAMP-binding protein
MASRFPALRFNAGLILVKQLREIEDRFREIATCRVAARLSRQIVRLVEQVGHRDNGVVEISISREELAQLIGTTLFTVSRLLSDWDRRGIIVARRNAVLVRDFKSLEDLAETESNSV